VVNRNLALTILHSDGAPYRRVVDAAGSWRELVCVGYSAEHQYRYECLHAPTTVPMKLDMLRVSKHEHSNYMCQVLGDIIAYP
jgi:hypothetical protein